MADSSEPGFEIRGRLYPFPKSFRAGDTLLIRELTGMEFIAFCEALDDEENEDERVTIGLLGTAIWQQHTTWRRDKVVRYVEGLDLESMNLVGLDDEPDDEEEGEEDSPPDGAGPEPAGGNDSETPPTPSTGIPDAS
jgi:hypothetical protein